MRRLAICGVLLMVAGCGRSDRLTPRAEVIGTGTGTTGKVVVFTDEFRRGMEWLPAGLKFRVLSDPGEGPPDSRFVTVMGTEGEWTGKTYYVRRSFLD